MTAYPAFLASLPPRHLSGRAVPSAAPRLRARPGGRARPRAHLAGPPPSSAYAQFAALGACAAAGQAVAARTRAGAALSAPVATMLAAAVLANAGLLPPAPPGALPAAAAAAARLATPLLLFGADLRVVFRDTRRLSAAFGVAVLGTVAGSLLGWVFVVRVLPGSMPVGAWQLAAAITGKNVGGGINYHGILMTYGAEATARFAAIGLCADNLLGLLYFPLSSYLCDRFVGRSKADGGRNGNVKNASAPASPPVPAAVPSSLPALPAMTQAIALALLVISIAEVIMPRAPLPTAAALTVALATAVPTKLAPLATAGGALGSLALYALFAAAGVSGGSLSALFGAQARATSLAFVAFCSVLYSVHVAVVILAVRAPWRRRRNRAREQGGDRAKFLLLASNAAIGGPATAAALASAKEYDDSVVPATVVGTFGNCIGSFVGLLVGAAIEMWLL